MMVKSVFFTLLVVIEICSLQCNAVSISVETEESLLTLPRSSFEAVSSLTILTCYVRPSNSSFISRWITPSGEIISRSTGRYSFNQGRVTSEGLGTVLAVQSLSYEDAGVYRCEVVSRGGSVSSCDCTGFPTSASVQLVLQVFLQAPVEEVVVVDEGMTAFLHCEMSGYILPDEDFLWFKGEDIISNGSRFSITYSNGAINSAQNGGSSTSPSRVSMLEIAATVLSDAGSYACRVRDKEVFANVSLAFDKDATTLSTTGEAFEPTETSVFQDDVSTTTGLQYDDPPLTHLENSGIVFSTSECSKLEQSRIVGVTFAVTFLVTVFACASVMIVIVACLWLKLRQQKRMLENKTTPLNTVGGDTKVMSAINAHACVLDGFSVDKNN